MKAIRWISYLLAVALFLWFQTWNLQRHLKESSLGGYSKSILGFIGLRDERTRILLFERNGKIIGYSSFTIAHIQADEAEEAVPNAEYRLTVASQAEVIPWLGSKGKIKLHAEILFDALCEALVLEGKFSAAGAIFLLEGKRDGSELVTKISSPDRKLDLSFRLPRNIGLGGAMLPIPPLGELSVGDKKTISYFDPIMRTHAECRIEVLKTTIFTYGHLKLKAYVVKVELPIGAFTITASPDGDVFKAAGPGDITIRRSSPLEVHHFFKDNDNPFTEGADKTIRRENRTERD